MPSSTHSRLTAWRRSICEQRNLGLGLPQVALRLIRVEVARQPGIEFRLRGIEGISAADSTLAWASSICRWSTRICCV